MCRKQLETLELNSSERSSEAQKFNYFLPAANKRRKKSGSHKSVASLASKKYHKEHLFSRENVPDIRVLSTSEDGRKAKLGNEFSYRGRKFERPSVEKSRFAHEKVKSKLSKVNDKRR